MNENEQPLLMPSEPSLQTRIQEYIKELPLVTKSVLVVTSSIYLAASLVGWDNLASVCLSANAITSRLQLWRLLTSALFHANLLHIAFNMMAFLQTGARLERSLGSFILFWLICTLIFLGDLLYVLLSYILYFIGYPKILYHCAVGFSSVIFGLLPIEITITRGATRSVFGFFTVPATIYPWLLLVLWQVLVPQSSFMGHLSGLAIGQLYVASPARTTIFKKFLISEAETIQRWESTNFILNKCMGMPSYIANTPSLPVVAMAEDFTRSDHDEDNNSTIRQWFQGLWLQYPLNTNASRSTPWQTVEESTTMTTANPLDPKVAAAAAAEARMKQNHPFTSSSSLSSNTRR